MVSIVEKKIAVPADPREVFYALVQLDLYPRYSKYIKNVEPIGHQNFRWRAGMWGLSISWEGELVDLEPPHSFGWHCTSGFINTGTIRIVPHSRGSIVQFSMKYDNAPAIVGRAVALLLRPKADKWISDQIMDAIQVYKTSC